ncbi:hypothetical protein [Streptomyces jeddahensis]|uniref:hypothetical protein n=1 Tax=Streptomyces jeddahensis TaxID=1716141 RepID=UPI0008346E5B|nr:hypothetical protein [Streptomyces jeddahensis]
MAAESPAYEVRYGWNRRSAPLAVALIACCAALLLALVVELVENQLSAGDALAYLLGLVISGGGGLFVALQARSRAVALRVDEKGVLLGGIPPRYRSTTAFVPWSEIEAVVLYRYVYPYIGVRRHPGLPPLPGSLGTGRISRCISHINTSLVDGVSADVMQSGRAAVCWKLDKERLAGAVARYAPQVELVDTDAST